MIQPISRRQFLKASTAGSLALGGLGCSVIDPVSAPALSGHPQVGKYHIYFGDLHNHNEVGYAWSSPVWVEARA